MNKEQNWGKHLSEEIGGYCGNEGVDKTTVYSRFLLVLWPKNFEFETLLKMDPCCVISLLHQRVIKNQNEIENSEIKKFENFLNYLENYQAPPAPKTAVDNWRYRATPKKQLNTFLHEKEIIEIMQLLARFKNLKYVEQFFSKEKPNLTVENSAEIARLIACFGYSPLEEILKVLVKPSTKHFKENCQLIHVGFYFFSCKFFHELKSGQSNFVNK